MNIDSLLEIMINAIFNGLSSGIGLGVGAYIAGNYLIGRFEKLKKKVNGGEKENEN